MHLYNQVIVFIKLKSLMLEKSEPYYQNTSTQKTTNAMRFALMLKLILCVSITTWAQSLRVVEEFYIPDSIVPGPYFQVSEKGEIFILANNSIFNLNKNKWIIQPTPNITVVSFSLNPVSGRIDYLSLYDFKTETYGLYQHIEMEKFNQLRLVRKFEPYYKIVHPIQIENEVFVFWEFEDNGFGFGKITNGDSITTLIELKENKVGPFTMINRNSLFFYLDNLMVNYDKNMGIKSVVYTPGVAQSICYDGYNGLHLATENGILHLSSDGTIIPFY